MPSKEHILNEATFQCHFPSIMLIAVFGFASDLWKEIICVTATLLTVL